MLELQEMFKRLLPGLCDIFGSVMKSVILYGSVVKGTNTAESDIDIAIIVNEYSDEMHDKMIDLAVEMELEYDKVLSLLLIDYDSFLEWENVLPFYKNVKKEGIVLWNAA